MDEGEEKRRSLSGKAKSMWIRNYLAMDWCGKHEYCDDGADETVWLIMTKEGRSVSKEGLGVKEGKIECFWTDDGYTKSVCME